MKQKLLFLAVLTLSSHAFALDVGFTQLKSELGSTVPDGSGVAVTQVEASIGVTETNVGAWMPDLSIPQFTGKNIVDQSVPLSNDVSDHATAVANNFYASGTSAMASGIIDVDVYSASDWLTDGFLRTASNSKPLVSNSRIANHSWVGTMDTDVNSTLALKRVDWLVEQDEFIQVTAMNNGSFNQPLLGSAFNVIAVGLTSGNHAQGSVALDSVYTGSRTRPDVVVPLDATSFATPVVSAAAAMLIEQAHTTAQGSVTVISNSDAIYNGERTEVVKAVIMAGADRTENAKITDYKDDPAHHTTNGLDSRFGAGQLNVYNNYQIMAASEQDSLQDGGETTVDMMGYDYDANFGGAKGSNDSASYLFETTQTGDLQLTASLVWNINIEDANGAGFNPEATLYNLDLFLFDITDGSESLLASSTSEIDNTENLWYFLEQDHDYQIQVLAADSSPFNWDYGLAWKIAPVPVPAAVWFFMTGFLGLFSVKHRYLS